MYNGEVPHGCDDADDGLEKLHFVGRPVAGPLS